MFLAFHSKVFLAFLRPPRGARTARSPVLPARATGRCVDRSRSPGAAVASLSVGRGCDSVSEPNTHNFPTTARRKCLLGIAGWHGFEEPTVVSNRRCALDRFATAQKSIQLIHDANMSGPARQKMMVTWCDLNKHHSAQTLQTALGPSKP